MQRGVSFSKQNIFLTNRTQGGIIVTGCWANYVSADWCRIRATGSRLAWQSSFHALIIGDWIQRQRQWMNWTASQGFANSPWCLIQYEKCHARIMERQKNNSNHGFSFSKWANWYQQRGHDPHTQVTFWKLPVLITECLLFGNTNYQ